MGRGNAKPQGVYDSKFFYLDNEVIEKYFFDFEDFKTTLQDKIKNKWDSFYDTDEWRRIRLNDYNIISKNSLVNIELGDNQYSTMLAITIEDYEPDRYDHEDKRRINLAYTHFKKYYDGVLDMIKEMFKEEKNIIFRRTGPWTSATIY